MTKRTWPKREYDPDERHKSGEEFLTAAMRYLTGYRPSEEWTPSEELAVRLVSELRLLFRFGAPDPDGIEILRRALHALRRPVGVKLARVYCVRAITEWGQRWKETDPSQRRPILLGLARELALHDESFAVFEESPEELIEKLERFETDSRLKEGSSGAARILAELIFEGQDALGLTPPDDLGDDDAIEWLRVRISRDVNDYLSAAETPEK